MGYLIVICIKSFLRRIAILIWSFITPMVVRRVVDLLLEIINLCVDVAVVSR